MALIGLNNLWYAKLTEAQDGTPTYGGAKSFGKAVSCNVSISNNSAALYADDVLAESDTTFQSGTVTLGVDDDREATFADVLGHNITDDGEVIYNSNDVAPWVGLARIVVKLVENVKIYKVEVLYKTKFSEPSEDNNTRGESVEFSTPSIEGTIATLANGDWKDTKTFATKNEAIAFIQSLFSNGTLSFSVVYDANGGTGSISTVSVEAGESTTLASGASLTAPSNKEFAGWSKNSSSAVAQYAAGDTYYPIADTVFFAVWVDET